MGTTHKILVVDDNATNRRILIKSLGKIGYQMLEACDGFEAVDIATYHKPDLILLDIMMPGRDGFEVGRILKSQKITESIPFIFLTAKSDAEDIDRAFSLGGCDYLTKPFKMGEVKARVSVHIQLRHAQRETEDRNKQLEEMSKVIAATNVELARQARTDPLTSLLNRRAWEESVTMEHDRCRRNEGNYSIIMIDVDYFKAYNDSLGHQAGDECLRRIASCIQSVCRTMDSVGRYGGEEFVVLTPQKKNESARVLGERIRKAINRLNLSHPASQVSDHVTTSMGVSDQQEISWEKVLEKADAALYSAKESGRNRVCTYDQSTTIQTIPTKTAFNPMRADASSIHIDDGRVKVLIVDDNATNRTICKKSLECDQYDISEAFDGHSALKAIASSPPHVILMDVMMAGMDGLECTRILKANPETQNIPIIMVSALADASDIQAGLQAGANEYLAKPIRPAELVLRVQSMARAECDRHELLISNNIRGEQTRILNVLLDLCRSLGATEDLDQVLDYTISATASLTGSRRISIMLPDNKREFLNVTKSVGIDDDVANNIHAPIGDSIAGRVFESGIRHIANDEPTGSNTNPNYDSDYFASSPLICTALGTAEHVIGIINVTDRVDGEPYKAQELEAVEMIASIAGTAISSIITRQSRNEARDAIMVAFAKLAERRDGDTRKHVDRVTQYCLVLAEELRKSEKFEAVIDDAFIYNLERAVPLHDIGKIAIPDNILLKPGRLTMQEMTIMKTHAEIGAETIRAVLERAPALPMLSMAEEIASSHHEWYDGMGYPQGLSGENIPLTGRIVALSDVYDAVTTKRPYKEAIEHDKAVTIILKSSGTQFDPAIVEAFMRHESHFKALSKELTDTIEEKDQSANNLASTSTAGIK